MTVLALCHYSFASSYITLSWDYGGQSINPAGVIQVKLTLRISSIIMGITDFSFDIIITGSREVDNCIWNFVIDFLLECFLSFL